MTVQNHSGTWQMNRAMPVSWPCTVLTGISWPRFRGAGTVVLTGTCCRSYVRLHWLDWAVGA